MVFPLTQLLSTGSSSAHVGKFVFTQWVSKAGDAAVNGLRANGSCITRDFALVGCGEIDHCNIKLTETCRHYESDACFTPAQSIQSHVYDLSYSSPQLV